MAWSSISAFAPVNDASRLKPQLKEALLDFHLERMVISTPLREKYSPVTLTN